MTFQRAIAGFALAASLLTWMPGCKKAVEAKLPTPVPTATPLPSRDILGFTRSGQLWVMGVDGSGAAPLAMRRDASFWFPSASPKGMDFVAWISRGDGSQDIVRIGLDGSITELTSIGERANPAMKNLRLANAPVYDSKALRIAYSFNGNLWIMNRDGENAETLIADGDSYSPAWSPDDKKIAYVNGKSGHYDLWVTDLESHDSYQVTDFQDYSVGQPRWVANGQRIMMTRSQNDASDIVDVLAGTDQPLVDADVITNDHASASAILDPDAKHLLYSSAQKDPPHWEIWVSDAAGKEGKALTMGGGVSPAWLRPQGEVLMKVNQPAPMAAAPVQAVAPAPAPAAPAPAPAAQPTIVLPKPAAPAAAMPTPMPAAKPVLPAQQAAAPMAPAPNAAAQAAKPMAPAAQAQAPAPAASAPKPSVPSQAPAASTASMPKPAAAAAASHPVAAAAVPAQKPAPTQPPVKAPPLRMKYKASFDADTDELKPGSLADLRKMSSRVKQYAGESIQIYGPLDRSSLKGHYASEEERSMARAQQVAAELAKQAGLNPASIQAQPYAPASLGAQTINGIQIYVVLK
jgi:outer membrane protein OmpA-like peptidoglycan-associated protein